MLDDVEGWVRNMMVMLIQVKILSLVLSEEYGQGPLSDSNLHFCLQI